MLEKLYNMGCLDYQRLIRMFSSKLELSSNASFVLMSILDNYHTNPNINSTNLAAYMGKSKAEVEESIVELLNLDYIQIQLVMKNGKSTESYRLSPFFIKCERLLSELKNEEEENDIRAINSVLEENLKRALSRQELEQVSDWLSDGKSKEEILDAIDFVKKTKNSFRLASVNKELYNSQNQAPPKGNDMITSVFAQMVKS
jgi:hypothetical protein